MRDKLKTNILSFVFEEPVPTWEDFSNQKEISNKWTLSENYKDYSYDSIAEIVDEKVYEFNSHLEALGTSLNDLTVDNIDSLELTR